MGTATTFTSLIAAPQSEKVFLCEAKPGEVVAGFTLTTDQTYTYQKSYLSETITLADSTTETIRKAIVDCQLDGTALTVKTSIAEVEGTAGTYWHDTANGILYIHPPGDDEPDDHTVVVFFWVYFATKGIVLDSRFYEPYIAENGIPAISQQTQEIHWGASQISSGAVTFVNSRGFFDQISKRWIWNNKSVKILMGGDSLAYSEYAAIFGGKIMQTRFSRSGFTIEIQSNAFALLRTLPINNFWISNYTNLDPEAEGKPIPYYWGVYSASQAPVVTCINTTYGTNVYQFKICDTAYHAIKAITQVYVDYGDGVGWQTIAHANEDLTNATFTITSASFVVGTSRVKVAFEGYHSGGTLIDGAPEVAEDLLTNQCGYASTDLNAASFTASKGASDCSLNVSVENETAALTVIETICQSDLAYFDEDGEGLLRYRTWGPATGSNVQVLTTEDILDEPEFLEDTAKLFYRAKVGYSKLTTGDYIYTEAYQDESRHKYGRDDVLTVETYLRSSIDAVSLAGRLNWITRNPSPIATLRLKAGVIDKTLGDKIKLTLERASHSTVGGYVERVFEIIGKEVSCFPLIVKLQARDIMEFGANVGIWTADDAPDWATATAEERSQSGFWTDDNGLADPSDVESKNKSLWW